MSDERCPTCGAAVRIAGEGETHWYELVEPSARELSRLRRENERLREINERQTSVFFDVETVLVEAGRWRTGIDGASIWEWIEADRQEIRRLRAALAASAEREADGGE